MTLPSADKLVRRSRSDRRIDRVRWRPSESKRETETKEQYNEWSNIQDSSIFPRPTSGHKKGTHLLLMAAPSLRRAPVAPVLSARSLPARSTYTHIHKRETERKTYEHNDQSPPPCNIKQQSQTRSERTRLILLRSVRSVSPSCFLLSILIVKMECEREERAFICVSAT